MERWFNQCRSGAHAQAIACPARSRHKAFLHHEGVRVYYLIGLNNESGKTRLRLTTYNTLASIIALEY